ncbi:MAG: FtsX-like permease family protein [Bacteroidales bacterium]|nr:FtsX-like permease family protein [Candidatus Cacconaster equi]
MNVSDFIARRYLFARKSLGVINIISMVSASGIAVGCAALIIILSIYNGFDLLVRNLNNSYTADILVQPSEGKTLDTRSAGFSEVAKFPGIRAFCPVIEENVFIQYEGRHVVAAAKGVDSLYERTTGLRKYLCEGSFELKYGDIKQMVLGRTIALRLGVSTSFVSPLEVYFPDRNGKVDMLDPMSSLHMERLFPGGIISLEQGFDQKYVFLPIESMRSLLEYESEATSVELYLTDEGLNKNGFAKKALLDNVKRTLGDGYTVKDKREQNQMLYKLLKYEKTAIYLILLFVVVIISFNIFSSLSMLIIAKRGDAMTLRSMGAEKSLINNIFLKEGLLVSALGIISGIVLGLLVCWLQQKFSLVKMPGNFVIDAYPVVVQWGDVALTALGVGLIGYAVSLLAKSQRL